ncbi:MAG: DUF3854 domain-containing protein [Pyrinomonadaceae bacterium MAG19_C2-C3]|nr:DUF3854 domain-containing protein [Pyrinomonadaceae bacterium MAG19_C2-C3]
MRRGLTTLDAARFGGLPCTVSERERLAESISRYLEERFPEYMANRQMRGVIGVPGFWLNPAGKLKLGKDYDYEKAALVIPYRDETGRIQACQLRHERDGESTYLWLSTAEDRLTKEPHGTSSGSPIHWTFCRSEKNEGDAIFITEGALKAEVYVKLKPGNLVIATAGVGVGHHDLIQAVRGSTAIIAFDRDHRDNHQVCKQLAKLISARVRDLGRVDSHKGGCTFIAVWEKHKGIDDAILAGIEPEILTIENWFNELPKRARDEVARTWQAEEFELSANIGGGSPSNRI